MPDPRSDRDARPDETPVDARWVRQPETAGAVGDDTLVVTPLPDPDPTPGWNHPAGEGVAAEPMVAGRYRLLRRLGKGGMGDVHLAHDTQLDRQVALKFLHAPDADLRRRFLKEALAQARVDHEHVCSIHDTGTDGGRMYIAMQFIDGQTLRQAAPSMPLEVRVALVRQVAEALHAAHRVGVVHRDIKPANVMVERDEMGRWKPYVLDFGLARELAPTDLTLPGEVLGTPAYMAPEQVRGDSGAIDRRCDVYGLGATLFELLAGRTPFVGHTAVEVLVQVLHQEPLALRRVAPQVPADLESIVMKCLERDPGRRYGSARALADDLGRFLDGEPVQARPAGVLYRLGKLIRKHRVLAGVVALALTLVLGSGLWAWRARWRAEEMLRQAEFYGLQVQELETIMLHAHTMPLHDTQREREMVRARLRAILSRLPEPHAPGRGPALYALGSAHLALQEPEPARQYLEEAWQAGYRASDVAFALGRALGLLYQAAVLESVRIGDPELRRTRQRELESDLLVPARHYLRQVAAGGMRSPALVEAWLALADRDFPLALDRAAAAAAQAPWLYPALLIEGQVRLEQAKAMLEAGRYQDAEHLVDQAAEPLAWAVDIARSDPLVHTARAQQVFVRMLAQFQRDHDIAAGLVEEALTHCDRALTAAADTPSAHVLRIQVHTLWGQRNEARGENPLTAWAAAEAAAAAGLGQQAGLAEIHGSYGAMLWRKGSYELARGGPAAATLAAAADEFRKALAINPGSAVAHHNLAISCALQGIAARSAGQDPVPALETALANYDRALDIEPGMVSAYVNRGTAFEILADSNRDRGLDPLPYLKRAASDYHRAVTRNPQLAPAHAKLGFALEILAEDEIRRGVDPRPTLNQALAAFDRSVALTPRYSPAHFGRALARQQQAIWEADHGQDPRPSLAEAVAAYEAVIQLKPGDPFALNNLANTHVALGLDKIGRGEDPGPEFQRAETALAQVVQANPGDYIAWSNMAFVHLQRAEYAGFRDTPAAGHLLRAEEALKRSRAANSRYFHAVLFEAMSARLRAETSPATARLDRWLELARQRVAEALAMRPDGGEALGEQARIELAGARYDQDRGGSPRGAATIARRAGEAWLTVNPQAAEGRLVLAEAALLLALDRSLEPVERAEAVSDGLREADRALTINPNLARARMVRGLLKDAAERTGVPGQPGGSADRAAANSRQEWLGRVERWYVGHLNHLSAHRPLPPAADRPRPDRE